MANELEQLPAYRSTMERLEAIKRVTQGGVDFWRAREMAEILQYVDWRNFRNVIDRAQSACGGIEEPISHHFVETTAEVKLGSGAKKNDVEDFFLSRLGCYLVAMNGDPSKPEVAAAQAYFAAQTRRMELTDIASSVSLPGSEDERRVLARDELKAHNKKLAGAAKSVGVSTPIEYAIFQNHGYQGLYDGLDMRGIQRKKGLAAKQDILDHMPSAELAANLFRATQTAEQLERLKEKGATGKELANRTHRNIGQKIRQTIKEIGGTMPEDYPAVEHVKEARKRIKKSKAPSKIRGPKTKPSSGT